MGQILSLSFFYLSVCLSALLISGITIEITELVY